MKVLVQALQALSDFIYISALNRNDEVVGIDNLNDYYDPALKQFN